jgi:hypothetical protein
MYAIAPVVGAGRIQVAHTEQKKLVTVYFDPATYQRVRRVAFDEELSVTRATDLLVREALDARAGRASGGR